MVDTAAESDPKDGSVMAIAAQTSVPSRASCSSVATPAMAALPSPCRGTDSSRAMSPQAISRALSNADMLAPLMFPFGPSSASRNASVPAKEMVFAAVMPSKRVARVSSSTG